MSHLDQIVPQIRRSSSSSIFSFRLVVNRSWSGITLAKLCYSTLLSHSNEFIDTWTTFSAQWHWKRISSWVILFVLLLQLLLAWVFAAWPRNPTFWELWIISVDYCIPVSQPFESLAQVKGTIYLWWFHFWGCFRKWEEWEIFVR